MVKLVIDMMGGDNGVNATVPAVKKLLNDFDDLFIVAVGEEDKSAELKDEKNVKRNETENCSDFSFYAR